MEVEPTEKDLRLRFAGTCRVCGLALPVKARAIYDRGTKTVRCVTHDLRPPGGPALGELAEGGTAGASARREFERRKTQREERIRAKHPKLGGFILAVTDEQQSTKAWDVGALGEESLGSGLNQLTSETLRLLHDRRVPGGKANIDHLAVTPTGVHVIDCKRYQGRPHLKIEGGLIRATRRTLTHRKPRLHQTRRRSTQAGRPRARPARRPRPRPRGALFRGSRLAFDRRGVYHSRGGGVMAQEAVSQAPNRRTTERRSTRRDSPETRLRPTRRLTSKISNARRMSRSMRHVRISAVLARVLPH